MVTTLPLLKLRNITDYLTPDYCVSCAYFQQAKGNYGTCKAGNINGTKYDGTRKGSGCFAWRINNDLQSLFKPSQTSTKTYHIGKSLLSMKISEFRDVQKNISLWAYGLPFTRTSDIHITRKYYRAEYWHAIIDKVIELAESGRSRIEIQQELERIFGKTPALATIFRWLNKYAPYVDYVKNRYAHRSRNRQCTRCGTRHSINIYGWQCWNKVDDQWFCHKCGSKMRMKKKLLAEQKPYNERPFNKCPQYIKNEILSLLDSGKSYNEIRAVIAPKYQMKLSKNTLTKYAHQYRPKLAASRWHYGADYPKEAHTRAYELHLKGHNTSQIIRIFEKEYGRKPSYLSIQKWVARATAKQAQ